MLCACKHAKKPIATCEECNDLLCVLCYNAHQLVRITKDHTLSIIDQDDNGKTSHGTQTDKGKNKGTQTDKPEILRVTADALKNNKRCKQFMGISLTLFNTILDALKGKFKKSYKMTEKDQLCLFYNKVKSNDTNGNLATTFGVEEQMISEIFKHMVEILFDLSRDHLWWLSKAEVQRTMPKSFRKHFPNVRVIIDATEIRQGDLHYWIGRQTKLLFILVNF